MDEKTSTGTISFPAIDRLIIEIQAMKAELAAIKAKIEPKQAFYDLKEACNLKGISYGSLTSSKYKSRQPNNGKPDAIICGRPRWTHETVQNWLKLSDNELNSKE